MTMPNCLIQLTAMLVLLSAIARAGAVDEKAPNAFEQALFDFTNAESAKDWSPIQLPGVDKEPPPPRIEVVPASKKSKVGSLAITFAGGDWPAIATSKIPVAGN